MQQQTKLLFLFLFLWMINKAHGQDNEKRAENTILKLDKNHNPYSKSQTKWLQKNGFNVDEYTWDNSSIYKQLNESLRRHRGAQYFGIAAGVGALLLGQRYISKGEVGIGYLGLTVTSGIISINKMNKSKRQVQQIEKWRTELAGNTSGNSVIPNDENKKEFSTSSPFKSSQNRYFSNKGFSSNEYNWDNEEINLELDRALDYRGTGHLFLGMSVGSFLIGSIFKMYSGIMENPENAQGANSVGNKFYLASAGLLTGSFIFTGIGSKKVKKAEELKKYPKAKKF